MLELQGKIDYNDLLFVAKRFGNPIAARPCPIKNNKINPQTTRFLLKDGYVVSVVHVKPIYYEALNGQWRPLSEVTDGFGNKWARMKEDWYLKVHPRFIKWWMRRMDLMGGNISFPSPFKGQIYSLAPQIKSQHRNPIAVNTTSTVYPEPGVTVDGFVGRNGAITEPWTTIVAGAGTTSGSSDTGVNLRADASTTTDQFKQLFRFIYLLDASDEIPDTDVISSATFSIYGDSEVAGTGLGDTDVDIVASTPASNTALVNADYAQLGTTRFATGVAVTAMNNSAYEDFALNASGIAAISKTGITKFGARLKWDVDNSFGGTWASNGVTYTPGLQFSDVAGTTQDPKLVVVHAAGATFMPTAAFFM